jgi:hypothetical protein
MEDDVIKNHVLNGAKEEACGVIKQPNPFGGMCIKQAILDPVHVDIDDFGVQGRIDRSQPVSHCRQVLLSNFLASLVG